MGPRGGVVTQRSAKPCTPVQFWSWPPTLSHFLISLVNIKSTARPAVNGACVRLVDDRVNVRLLGPIRRPLNKILAKANPPNHQGAPAVNQSCRKGRVAITAHPYAAKYPRRSERGRTNKQCELHASARRYLWHKCLQRVEAF